MNFKRIAASLLACAMSMTLFGCELVSVNKERDNAQVVMSIGDKTYSKEIINGMANTYLSMYGITDFNSDVYDDFRVSILDSFAKEQALNYYAVENGYRDKLTQEDYAEIDADYAEAETRYNTELYNEIKTELGYTDEEGAPEFDENAKLRVEKKLAEKQKEYLISLGAESLEGYKNDLVDAKAAEAYKAHLESTVSITEENIKAEYDKRLSEQKTSYENDISGYMDAVDGGEVVVYNPAGVRRVKNLLIKIDEAKANRIKALEEEIAELEDGETKTNKQSELDILKRDAYGAIEAKANEALNQAKSGVGFDSLIEKYGEDEGAATNPEGYLMHEKVTDKYVANFQSAGMALSKVGDISGLVETEYGYHILMYASDVTPGQISIDAVREDLNLGLTAAAKAKVVEEKTTEVTDNYKNSGVLKIYTDRMKTATVPGKQ